ncbi:MAG TPA: fumarylacetoacetase [Burkholderiaceae bacterium]
MRPLDRSHEPDARSWVASAEVEDTDFPIQNLPFAVFRRLGRNEMFRGGVAIGEMIVDLGALHDAAWPALHGLAAETLAACAAATLNDFFAMGPAAWRALRHALFDALEVGADDASRACLTPCLVAQADAEYALPVRIGDFTDFFTSYYHADNIGRLFSKENDVVPPAFHWLPQAYHGRTSSIGVSGQQVRRPLGQTKAPGAAAPSFGPSARLDYEMELGFFVGTDNPLGTPVPLADAGDHLFGACLLNDWSARDIQAWEMQPLGPFLSKNLATTISPWVVTMDALLPYRMAWSRERRLPKPLRYLDSDADRQGGAIDICLETWLETASRRAAQIGPVRIAATSFRHQHWTIAQMLAHHTIGGCNLRVGDLLGTGTISGPTPFEAAAMMELSKAGGEPLRLEGVGGRVEERSFLEDGDAVILKGWCEKPGRARIGFGSCRGEILPALALAGVESGRATHEE